MHARPRLDPHQREACRLPAECLDYVVAHELAHLIEPSHNARFHAIVARAIGNERAIRARLRQPPATA